MSMAYAKESTLKFMPRYPMMQQKGELQFKIPPLQDAIIYSDAGKYCRTYMHAVIVPAFKGNADLSKPYRFSVIAENGDKKDYLVVVYH
jgi:hypothetical protein